MVEVPLVVYDAKGQRQVIGTAEVNPETGEIKTEIHDHHMAKILNPDMPFSIAYNQYHQVKEVSKIHEPIERKI